MSTVQARPTVKMHFSWAQCGRARLAVIRGVDLEHDEFHSIQLHKTQVPSGQKAIVLLMDLETGAHKKFEVQSKNFNSSKTVLHGSSLLNSWSGFFHSHDGKEERQTMMSLDAHTRRFVAVRKHTDRIYDQPGWASSPTIWGMKSNGLSQMGEKRRGITITKDSSSPFYTATSGSIYGISLTHPMVRKPARIACPDYQDQSSGKTEKSNGGKCRALRAGKS
ncbi:hypothetical protein ARMSODRAFT_971652 [Armillaria solidipes]|uniref:Uncharacterized protein n=1 Tax=Armillaria solidipes TaxID=1076256 RepID=A0A2H3BXY5_9AGAR|nr:hypothetical protein ARMSODRAFT_971652 [Armillaria solidipes]